MPLYEYQCQTCHRRVEKIQKFSDAPLTVCPHCGGALERTLTAPAVQFKGAGWYKDLYSSARPAAATTGTNEGTSGAGNTGGEKSGSAAPEGGKSPSATAAPAPSAPSTTTPTGS